MRIPVASWSVRVAVCSPCWFYGNGEHRAADVVVQGARLSVGSKQWSTVFLMADTPGFPDCNPVLFVDRRERLWLFWVTVLAERWECSQLKYRRAKQADGSGRPVLDLAGHDPTQAGKIIS